VQSWKLLRTVTNQDAVIAGSVDVPSATERSARKDFVALRTPWAERALRAGANGAVRAPGNTLRSSGGRDSLHYSSAFCTNCSRTVAMKMKPPQNAEGSGNYKRSLGRDFPKQAADCRCGA